MQIIDHADRALAAEISELQTRSLQAVLGHADFGHFPHEIIALLNDTSTAQNYFVLHRDADDVLRGAAQVTLDGGKNAHIANVDFITDPECDPIAVLEALRPGVEKLTGSRTSVTWWVYSPLVADGLAPQSGDLPVEKTAITQWLSDHGFTLIQTESASTLHVDNHRAEYTVAAGYALKRWVGPAPEEYVDDVALLCSRLATDAPTGGVEFAHDPWDAERVRSKEEALRQARREHVWTVAFTEDGAPAGYTFLVYPEDGGDFAFQHGTLVLSEHRGHGLGLAMKLANLAQLREVAPHIKRIHTWNASENEWMLRINEQLGSHPTSVLGAWERKA
ncbi:GNAT family N-acetyltransferase [Corynebacterium tapiri]|uniref:N-acetyltransferase domain-containing protein n=1 Tax=Corynebacterium tapiri TaxID=1448266 RepID=A0A5C4U5G9_9CORY|nr:GNAT family N-acetyltransferase [Corynebacterium tapiri]TNL98721.1 hypothetical protein FHE74_03615 [Corynebacterium tapiri]